MIGWQGHVENTSFLMHTASYTEVRAVNAIYFLHKIEVTCFYVFKAMIIVDAYSDEKLLWRFCPNCLSEVCSYSISEYSNKFVLTSLIQNKLLNILLMGERTEHINNNNIHLQSSPRVYLECTFGNYHIYKVPIELLLTEFLYLNYDIVKRIWIGSLWWTVSKFPVK